VIPTETAKNLITIVSENLTKSKVSCALLAFMLKLGSFFFPGKHNSKVKQVKSYFVMCILHVGKY